MMATIWPPGNDAGGGAGSSVAAGVTVTVVADVALAVTVAG